MDQALFSISNKIENTIYDYGAYCKHIFVLYVFPDSGFIYIMQKYIIYLQKSYIENNNK
jgi:hypothetical protein